MNACPLVTEEGDGGLQVPEGQTGLHLTGFSHQEAVNCAETGF